MRVCVYVCTCVRACVCVCVYEREKAVRRREKFVIFKKREKGNKCEVELLKEEM